MEIKGKKIFYLIVIIAILIRVPLLFLNPISMFADPVARFIPNIYDILNGDFSFYTPPLLMVIGAFPAIFLNGFLLELVWKLIPFLFFVLSSIIFMKILEIIELKKVGKILLLCLFLFSIYSILLSTSIMLEMPVLFFTLGLFYILETQKNQRFSRVQKSQKLETFTENEKIDFRLFLIISLISALLIYSKETGYFILAGFFLYVVFKKIEKKQKKLILVALILGLLLNGPWIIKNQIIHGNLLGNPEGVGKLTESGLIDFKFDFSLISEILHYSYRIPLLSKLNYSGIFFTFSRIYYFSFLIISIFLSLAILSGILKFGLKYKRYLLMIFPIFLFVFWLAFLSPLHWAHDFGRYMFSFYFLFFFFGLKFVESLKNIKVKKIFYLIIILFCIFSIVTSFAISFDIRTRDNAIRGVSEIIKDKEGIFIANDMFTTTTLKYYSGKKIQFLLDENKIDENIKCDKEIIYSSEKYKVSAENSEYHICRL